MKGYQHDDDGNVTICRENMVKIIKEDMELMTDGERIELMNDLMDGYCKHCGTRCLPCSCQAFWMEH